MQISELWATLPAATRDWLIDHNGEELTDEVLVDLVAANGGSDDPSWWAEDAAGSPMFDDEVVDWIEAVANGEEP